jgi:hypothetical protein
MNDDFRLDAGTDIRPQNANATPNEIERQLLAVTKSAPSDELAAALAASEWLMSRAKAIRELCFQIAIAWIEQNGDLVIGPIRYRVTYFTATRCKNKVETANAVLEKLGGDLDAMFAALISQPFKPGHVREILEADVFNSLFSTQRVGRLVDGVCQQSLQRIDERFVPKHKR